MVNVDTSRRDAKDKEWDNYWTLQDNLKEHGFNTEKISNYYNPYVAITPRKIIAFRCVAKIWEHDNPCGFKGRKLIITTDEKWDKYLPDLTKACQQYEKTTKTRVIIEVV